MRQSEGSIREASLPIGVRSAAGSWDQGGPNWPQHASSSSCMHLGPQHRHKVRGPSTDKIYGDVKISHFTLQIQRISGPTTGHTCTGTVFFLLSGLQTLACKLLDDRRLSIGAKNRAFIAEPQNWTTRDRYTFLMGTLESVIERRIQLTYIKLKPYSFSPSGVFFPFNYVF